MTMAPRLDEKDRFAASREAPIDRAEHLTARRIADVLRHRSAQQRIFLIDDAENIEEAAARGIRLDSMYVASSAPAAARARLCNLVPGVEVTDIDDAVLHSLFGTEKHARCFALARAPRRARLHDLRTATGDILVLDGVRVVGNIGAIIRTACAFGSEGIIVLDSGLRSVLDRRLIRASRGLVFALPVVLTAHTDGVEFLAQSDLSVAVLSAQARTSPSSLREITGRVALVLGGERNGVSDALAAVADHHYGIPMARGVDSLNVSVAAAIGLYARRAAHS